jgi:eukaryotic-like serine/threonine-protein kinase
VEKIYCAEVGTESDYLFGVETEPERYELVQELASGGMATVFLARTRDQTGAPKLVAVKRIHRHLAREQSFLEMFFDEARIAAQIRHPNVCTLLDFGRSGAVFYIAMEYVLGETLFELVRVVARDRRLRESLRWQIYAATVVADACEALHAVHELTDEEGQPMHVVHRDISPNNIFVTYEGGVKVVDFGIAYAQNKVHHTQTGTLKGKVGYMPPELIAGDGRDVDRRADVWALGVCLWELLAGALLFRGPNEAATMLNVIQRSIPSLESLAGVPAALDVIVSRALERDRAARCPTAQAFGSDLRRWIASTGMTVDAAEIAEFMQTRFAPQYARKLDVLEEAQTATGTVGLGILVDDQITQRLPIRSPSPPTLDSGQLMRPSASVEPALVPLSPDAEPVRAVAPPVPPPPERRRRRWAAFSVAIGGAVLAVGGTGLALWSQEQSDGRDGPTLTVATKSLPAATAGRTPASPADPSAAPVDPAASVDPSAPDPAAPADPSAASNDASTGSGVTPPTSPTDGVVEPPADPPVAVPDEPAASADDESGSPPDSAKRQETRLERSSRRKREAREKRRRARRREEEHVRVSEPEPPDDPPARPEPPVAEPEPQPEPPRTKPTPTPPKRTGPLVASVAVGSLEVQGSLVNSMVSRGIDRVMPSLKTCYREAAVAAGKNARCSVRVKLFISELGAVSRATASGGQLPGLDACVRRVAQKIRTVTPPDVGGATASFEVRYTPQEE